MFSLKLVLVCDQVLNSHGTYVKMDIGTTYIEHIGYNGFYVQARVY